eukprot:GILI01001254.1.p1 GENE.GILI01001254.1~~GILI01001254.1.p1  ORF type:complete len:313 (+),score=119.92 GILI01001254.1:46-984(+)
MGVTEKQVETKVEEIMKVSDLDTLTVKGVMTKLKEHFEEDVSGMKAFVKQCIDRCIAKMDEEEEEEAEEKAEKEPKKKGSGGLSRPMVLSPELSEFLGGEASAARTAVVKRIWEYVKAHDLQNPKNKKEILIDEKLGKVFKGLKKIGMFEMSRLLSKHLKNGDDLVGGGAKSSTKSKGKRKREESESEESESEPEEEEEEEAKRPKKKPKAATVKKESKEKGKEKKKGSGGGGLQKPLQPSAALASFLGSDDPIARTQAVKKIWEYVKAKDLQNPQNRKEFILDEKLGKLFKGRKKIDMFECSRELSQHFVS